MCRYKPALVTVCADTSHSNYYFQGQTKRPVCTRNDATLGGGDGMHYTCMSGTPVTSYTCISMANLIQPIFM